jgi:hypothetical protein
MNIISIAYCPTSHIDNSRIIEEHKIVTNTARASETHIIVHSQLFTDKDKVYMSDDKTWVYQIRTSNPIIGYLKIRTTVGKIKVKNLFTGSPWVYEGNGMRLGFTHKKIDIILTDEILLSQVAGSHASSYYKAPLSVVFASDLFSFSLSNLYSVLNSVRAIFSRFLIEKATAVSLGTVLIEQRIKNIYRDNLYILEKLFVLPRFIDFDALEKTVVVTDLRIKYPQFKFIIVVHTELMGFGDLSKLTKSVSLIKKHFTHVGVIVVGSIDLHPIDFIRIKLSRQSKNFVFEGDSRDWISSPISYFKTANMFIMRPDTRIYDIVLLQALSASCPSVIIKNKEINKFFTQEEMFLIDGMDSKKIYNIILDIVNHPADIKEKTIAMKGALEGVFKKMETDYTTYTSKLLTYIIAKSFRRPLI